MINFRRIITLLISVSFIGMLAGCGGKSVGKKDTTDSGSKSSKTFGPDEWIQYRFNSQNNAVYNGGKADQLTKTFQTDNQVRATPVVVKNRLFVGNHRSGSLNAYDLRTGKRIWKQDAPNWVHSEMIYKDGVIYVGYGNRYFNHDVGDPYIRGTRKSGVMALNAKNGKIKWQFKTEGEVMPTPVFYKGNVYAVSGDRNLYAIDKRSGKKVWDLDMGSFMSMSSPNLYKGTLYFGGRDPGKLFAVDLDIKQIRWETDLKGTFVGTGDVPPAIYKGKNIYTTGVVGDRKDPKHILYAVDLHSGKIHWKKELGGGKMVQNNRSGAPTVYKNKVFVASPFTKKFYAYDARTGKKVWEYQNDSQAKAPPVADDGIVFFGDTKGRVYAFSAGHGKLKGVKKLKGKLSPAGPVIMNENLIIGSQSGKVYTIPTKEIIGKNDVKESGKAN